MLYLKGNCLLDKSGKNLIKFDENIDKIINRKGKEAVQKLPLDQALDEYKKYIIY